MKINDIKKIDNYEQAEILSGLLKLMWMQDPKASERSESIWDKEIMHIDSLLAEWNEFPHCTTLLTEESFYDLELDLCQLLGGISLHCQQTHDNMKEVS
tara:strand:+ start:2079 stop:2375 length:297 start_codon:yes stop_codon:yes gene_type:complete